MIYRYIYKITCTAGSFKNKYYYGKHTTENLDDHYKGSGKKLWHYYKKHPNDYIKEIIAYYDTEDELNKAEYDIIHPHLGNKMCLNMVDGGSGGNCWLYKTEEEKKQFAEKISKTSKGRTFSEESKKKSSISHTGQKGTYGMQGKQHSEESKRKISESRKGKGKGIKTRLGAVLSEETKQKIRESINRYYANRN